jgi:hypothetical protein
MKIKYYIFFRLKEELGMFVHLGGDTLVSTKEIVIILNYENNTKVNNVNEYVKKIQGKRTVKKLEGDNLKTIVVTDNTIYLSPISSMTLKKRAEYIDSLV